MAMNRFSYAAASTVDEALEVLGADCRPLAGGVDLLDRLKEGLIAPDQLVSLKQVGELAQVRADEDGLHVGALVSLAALGGASGARWAGVGLPAPGAGRDGFAADPAHGDAGRQPAAAAALLVFAQQADALSAQGRAALLCFSRREQAARHPGRRAVLHCASLGSGGGAAGAGCERDDCRSHRACGRVPLGEFYLLPRQDAQREAALDDDELLVEVTVPTPAAGSRGVYLKVAERGEHDFALASVASR